MKQKLTSEDITCLVPALNTILDGAYLVQVYDGSKDNTRTIIMKFKNKVNDINMTYYLLLESGTRVHTINDFTNVRSMPTGMVSKLRRELGDRRLFPIKQNGTDRSLDFAFSNDKHFIIELYDRGNFIITNSDYKIIYIVRPYELNTYKVSVDEQYPIEIISNSGPEFTKDITQAKGFIIDKCNFSGFPLENNKNVLEFDNINIAMKQYFSYNSEIKILKISKKNKSNLTKDEKKIKNIKQQIENLEQKEEKQHNIANILENNVDNIQKIIDIINKKLHNNISYKNIELYLKDRFNEYNDIKLNYKFLSLDQYIIDYNNSAYTNISNIFSNIKLIAQKKKRAQIAIYTNICTEIQQIKKIKVNRKYMRFEDFWWFMSNEYIIMCGKNADDNEFILNNLEPSDIIVHGDFDKSPWAVIKNPNKIEIPLKIIYNTGQFVVHRSWNWVENYANKSYYTFPDKISKSAPSGEYMGKGSRMVHEKNYLSNATMEMGIGIIFKSKNKYLYKLNKDIDIDFAMVMCAPYITMSIFDYRIKVKSSGKNNNKGRKKLLNKIISKFLSIKNNHPLVKEYIKNIPYEEWDKVCIRTFTL